MGNPSVSPAQTPAFVQDEPPQNRLRLDGLRESRLRLPGRLQWI